MYPWNLDAREAMKETSDINDELVEKTREIEQFLSRDQHYFVVATKGLGKSLLLLVKRKLFKGASCIPRNILLDVPELSLDNLNSDMRSILYSEESMEKLWSLSIIIAIVRNLNMADNILRLEISDSLKYLLKQNKYTVSDYFSTILSSLTRRDFFKELLEDYNQTLIIEARTINKSVAVFIDNIDECFGNFSDKRLWYIAQIGLVHAAYKLNRQNPGKIKIYASIRKEAFLKLQEHEMFLQYNDVSLSLEYSKEELKQIFIKRILQEDEENLVEKSLKKATPITAFLGCDVVYNDRGKENEEIFDYIYRHTLKTPRDLMVIGTEIAKCRVSERNPSNENGRYRLKQLINEAGTKIYKGHIQEILRHLTIKQSDLEKLFSLVNSNALNKADLKRICMKYNGNDDRCRNTDCKLCKKTHIFCELYKTGLLGYVTEDSLKEKTCKQIFPTVGDGIFDEVIQLPDSEFYLLHPILTQPIIDKNGIRQNPNPINIIGYGRPWKNKSEKPQIIESAGFYLDKSSCSLVSKKNKSVKIPLQPLHFTVLDALLYPLFGKNSPIGTLPDNAIADIVCRVKNKGQSEGERKKKLSEDFARSLRRYLKRHAIYDKDAIIMRTDGGFGPGKYLEKKPRSRSEVPIVRNCKKNTTDTTSH
ncbi:MAG: hypothetical protein HQK96_07535 [Nitrospirae bacterium]|nr:hypothetical protein [Nitrospirota bacterium]